MRATASSSTPVERNRRFLQVALGVTWLVDAALQFQPYMFTKQFVAEMLQPTAAGNPWILSRPMIWADRFMIHDIALWNALYATIQLLIALGLFWRPTVRIALSISIIWSLALWWFAEGCGGVFASATPMTGAPGAVILYALLAMLVWPRRSDRKEPSVAESGSLGRLVPKVLWAVLWGSSAYFFLLPVNRGPQGLHDVVAGMSSGEPGWIQSLDSGLASVLNRHGTEFSLLLGILSVLVAVAIFAPHALRPVLVVAIVLSVAMWLTEDFGGIFTSQGTDVNSGPLLAMLAWAYWPVGAGPGLRSGLHRYSPSIRA